MSGLTRDRARPNLTLETKKLSGVQGGQGKFYVPCSADVEQDWQSNPVDAQSYEIMTLSPRCGCYIVRARKVVTSVWTLVRNLYLSGGRDENDRTTLTAAFIRRRLVRIAVVVEVETKIVVQ